MEWEELIKVLAKEIYNDGLKPTVIEAGSALESVAKTARFLLAPIDILAAYQNRFQGWVKKISDKVPEDRMISPHPSLAGPILESLKWIEDNSLLEEMFIGLLSCAMDKDKVADAHPAFVNILKQLSPDEAFILSEIKKHGPYEIDFKNQKCEDQTLMNQLIRTSLPTDNLVFPENVYIYSKHITNLNLTEFIGRKTDSKTREEGVMYRNIGFSQFGKIFANSCIPDFHGNNN